MSLLAGEHAAADELLPKSSSSAMPDPDSDSVPRLKARVHGRLTPEECASIPLSSLQFRPLGAEDYQEMVALHTEWFPVTYDEAFYSKSTSGEIFTLAATHRKPGQAEDDVVGIITMSTCPEHYSDDIFHVLGVSFEELPPPSHEGDPGVLAYILTLGVIDGFRRRGMASEMLRQAVAYVEASRPNVHAIYLHVVTYNGAAIQLYESMRFARLAHFPSFYHLHGQPYDSYLYALFMHGSRPPWKWRLRQFLGLGSNTWKDWVLSAWGSLRFWSPGPSSPPPTRLSGASPTGTAQLPELAGEP